MCVFSQEAILWWDGSLGGPYRAQLINGGFLFWKALELSKSEGETIARFVLQIYSCVASEAPCERIFSKMKNMISQKRYLLSPQTVFDLLVLGNEKSKNK